MATAARYCLECIENSPDESSVPYGGDLMQRIIAEVTECLQSQLEILKAQKDRED
jgi:hypothetical protein